MSRVFRFVYHLSAIILAGCTSLAPLLTPRPPTPAGVTPSPQAVAATPTPEASATQTASARQPQLLRIWLPPQFDPNAGTASANLLKQRLADFQSQHPGLQIELRIKAEEGDTGMLNSLSITSMAAPAALPDLVALSRPAFEAAALKGLLHPINGLSTTLQDPNWYGYARQLGQVESIDYGLPFAGDVLSLMYRAELGEFSSWEDILASEAVLSFPAGDPQGLVGLSLYVSGGGEIVNAQGMPTLNQEVLTRLLTLIQNGLGAGMLSPAIALVASDAQALQLYRDRNANMVISWASNYRPPADEHIMPLPGLNEIPYAFANGWMWSLAGSNVENQALAVELAEYLIADEFISEWTRESGYLPTRPSSLDEQDPTILALIDSAKPLPSNEILAVLGQLMQDALIRVLNGEQPKAVAASVIEALK